MVELVGGEDDIGTFRVSFLILFMLWTSMSEDAFLAGVRVRSDMRRGSG